MESIQATAPNFTAIKAKQQATWAAGDFGRIGVRLQMVGESLCEAADVHAGERVLDVAAGNGNASLAAARRSGSPPRRSICSPSSSLTGRMPCARKRFTNSSGRRRSSSTRT